ncbi:thioredoxin family protein [Thermococcus sp.]
MDELEIIRRKKMLELMKRTGMIEVKPKKKVVIEVITSPGCPYCPRALGMAKELEKKYEGVVARELSVSTPEGRRKAVEHNLLGTPTILIDNNVEFVGVPDFAEFEKRVGEKLG